MRELLPWQLEAINQFRGNPHAAFFLQQRLGKLITVTRWLWTLVNDETRRILVLSPKTCMFGWQDHLTLEEESEPVLIDGPRKKRIDLAKDIHGQHRWFLCAWETLRATPELADLPWDAVILDESVQMKNPKAKITKLIQRRFGRVPVRAILSGNPTPEDMLEFFEQCKFVCGRAFMGASNYWNFRDAYFYEAGFKWIPKPGFREKLDHALRECSFRLTREEAGVGSKKLRRTLLVDPPTTLLPSYLRLAEEWLDQDARVKHAMVKDIRLLAMCSGLVGGEMVSHHKLRALELDVRLKNPGTRRFVVWSWFREEIAATEAYLQKKGFSCVVVHGGVKGGERTAAIRRFMQGKVEAIICQIATGRFGLDLSVADRAYYLSNSWSGDHRVQSEDRLININKTRDVELVDVVVEGWIDADLADLQRGKRGRAVLMLSNLRARLAKRLGRTIC